MKIYEILKDVDEKNFFLNENKVFLDKNLSFDNEKDKNLYFLIRKVCFSLSPQISLDGNITFTPSSILGNLSSNDFELLKSLELKLFPINIRTRITDFLWSQKREFQYGQQALEDYIEWLQLLSEKDDYLEDDFLETFLFILRRALNLSRQFNQKKKRKQITDLAYALYLKLEKKNLEIYFLDLIEILIKEKQGDPNKIINSLNNFILNTIPYPNVIDKAYTLMGICFKNWKNDLIGYKNTNKNLAQFYEKLADDLIEDNPASLGWKENYLLQALSIYRKILDRNGEQNVQKKLILVQKNWPYWFRYFPKDRVLERKINYFTERWKSYLSFLMDRYSFPEFLERLFRDGFLAFPEKKTLEEQVISSSRTPEGHLFIPTYKDSYGKTIFQLSPLDIENPRENSKLFENYTYFQFLNEIQFKGDIYLKPLFQMLRDKYYFKLSDLDFLIKSNPILPKGRETMV